MMMSQAKTGDQTTEEHHPQYDASVIIEEKISDLEIQQILDDLEQDKKTATTDEESSSLQGETEQDSKINAEIPRSKDEQTVEELLEYSSWIIDINGRPDEYLTNVEDDGGNQGFCIYSYPPDRFKSIQPDSFFPKFVTVGDNFIGKHEMNDNKERVLVRLLGGLKNKSEEKLDENRSSNDEGRRCKGPVKLEDLLKSMNLLLKKTRNCYTSKKKPLTAKDMVLDGCFVIEVFRLHWHLSHHSSKPSDVLVKDAIFRSSATKQRLLRDFLVFGNQLPFFVLKELYSLTRSDENTAEPPLRCLAIHFLRDMAGEDEEDAGVSLLEDDPRADDCLHLLHLFSYACTNKPQRFLSLQDIALEKKEEKVQVCRGKKLTYNAKELQEAGVKIKPKPHTKGGGLMAIDTFKGTTLRIQPFYLDNNVVSMLLNFLAFEQRHPKANPYFTSYIMFLDCLIDSEADVEVLHKAGILNHAFGNNKDVADIIYKVARELNDPDYNHFHREMTELNTYCKAYYGSKWRPWWRNLIRNYFSSPWTITSLIAATILLILTFIQTFYTSYAYYKPPN